MGNIAGEGSVAVYVGNSERCKVINDRQHATGITQYVTCDIFDILIFLPFPFISVRFDIGATICMHQEIQCFP